MPQTTETEVPALLTVRAAAEEANVSPQTIYRAIGRGEFPAVRVGTMRAWRVPRDAFRAWLFGPPGRAA